MLFRKTSKSNIKHVDCVIGMSDAIHDDTARGFGDKFYEALAFGKSIQYAFDLGIVHSKLLRIPEEHISKLILGNEIDKSKLFVTDRKGFNEIKDHKKSL